MWNFYKSIITSLAYRLLIVVIEKEVLLVWQLYTPFWLSTRHKLFGFICIWLLPPFNSCYNACELSKDNGWGGAIWALIIVFGITGAIWLGVTICKAIQAFYTAHTFWFWFIIAVIIISPICYFLRFEIVVMFHHIFNRKKPDKTDKQNNK